MANEVKRYEIHVSSDEEKRADQKQRMHNAGIVTGGDVRSVGGTVTTVAKDVNQEQINILKSIDEESKAESARSGINRKAALNRSKQIADRMNALNSFFAKNMNERSPSFAKKYPDALITNWKKQGADFNAEMSRIQNKLYKRGKTSDESTKGMSLEEEYNKKSKDAQKDEDNRIKRVVARRKRDEAQAIAVAKSLGAQRDAAYAEQSKAENDQKDYWRWNQKEGGRIASEESKSEKQKEQDQKDYWRWNKKEGDRIAKEEKNREKAVEKFRTTSHKKRITQLKSLSGISKSLGTLSLSANMSMLGIMFSFMSLFSMVSGIFGTIFTAAANLTGAVTGGALSEAFLGQRVDAEGNPVEMDIGLLVEGYKKSLGVQGEMSYQMSLLASTLLNNKDFFNAVMGAVQSIADTFSRPDFIDSAVKSAKTIMDMMPDILNALQGLLNLSAMLMPYLNWALPLILGSVILLPILSLFNAVFGVVAMGFAVTNDLLATILIAIEANRLVDVAEAAATTAGATAVGSGAGGVLGGILGGLTWTAIGEGIGSAISGTLALGGWVTGAAVAIGLLIGLIGVGILDALGILDWIGEIGKGFGDWLDSNWVGTLVKDFIVLISSGALLIGSLFVGFIEGGIGGAIDKFGEAVEIIKGIVLEMLTTIVNNIIGPFIGLIDSLLGGISNILSNLSENVLTRGISDTLGLNWYPDDTSSNATGGYIANTGMALVHQGEYISNSSETQGSGSNIAQNVTINVYGDLDDNAADKVIDELVSQQRYSSWS